MASTDIQIVNISNLEKIQSFLNDSAYKEVLENSENFNTRLCIERRLRMPFLDPQTGVAQNHCALFMKQKQRMPGFREGQIYTYPSSRWRKPKRQYLLHHNSYKAFSFRDTQGDVSAIPSIDGSSLSASADNDSKDSHRNDEKEWFYDEMELNHVEDFEDVDSDLDFDESYSGRRRKRKYASRKSVTGVETTPAKRGRRGRKKGSSEGGESRRRPGPPALPPNTSSSPLNSDDPQMPVLTPEQKILGSTSAAGGGGGGGSGSGSGGGGSGSGSGSGGGGAGAGAGDETETGTEKKKHKQRSGAGGSSGSAGGGISGHERSHRDKADPSPYCDFCLGDARENKKTCLPEELVSCSDCGRSGHPTCLQFTPNMIVSVKRYRWQCIECKYCSICGTSDNDDQLLFCDDCDRGYHMYCLSPPLTDPPEGSWSCKLCLDEFHSSGKNENSSYDNHKQD